MRAIHSALLAALLSAACSEAEGPNTPAGLPPDIMLRGVAMQSYPDGSEVSCSFHVRLEWDRVEWQGGNRRRYIGRMGGESARSVLDGTGAGLAFFADMAWPAAVAEVIEGDSVMFDLAAGGEPSVSPFWNSFTALTGVKESEERWSGPWTCLPMGNSGTGYVDTTLTASGYWEIGERFVQKP
jgi:hypothetical protein